MEDEPLERLAALGDDEQAARRTVGDERLLDGPAAGDELFVVRDQVGGRDAGSVGVGRSGRRLAPGAVPARPAARSLAVGSRSIDGTEAGPIALGAPGVGP